MSLRIASRCLLILLFSTVLSAQEPSGKPVADTPKPRVIVIETTPDIERSEVLRKVIEALEKEGTVKHATEEDRIGKPVGYMAQISARPDTPSESLQKLIKELQAVGIEKFSLRPTNEAESSVTITAPADVSLRQARRIGEVLAKHPQFEFEFLEATNNDPVTPNSPQPSVFAPVRTPTPSPFAPKVPNKSAPSAVQYRDAPSAGPKKPSAVKICALKNARAAAAARIIEQLWGKEISVAADEQANSLIVRGNDERIQEIVALLMELDGPVPTVPTPSGSALQPRSAPSGSKPQTQSPQGPVPLAFEFNDANRVSSQLNGASQLRGFSFNVATTQESVVELRKRSEALDQQSRQMAEQFKGPLRDPSEGDKLKELLRATVQKAFVARQELLRAENSELVRRLHALQQSVEMRDRVSQQIIDRRIDELLNPDKQWQWNATVPAATAPTANAASSEVTAAEPSPSGDDNKLLIRRSETSVKVEGRFDGNEEIVLVIGDPRFTAIANTAQELKDVKELKWTSPVHKAGEYVIEVRQDAVKLDGGATAPGLVFEVHNVPNTVQSTSYLSFTDKDPLPNGKVVIASPKIKLLLKRKTDQVLVTVGHVELPDAPPGALTVVPINIVIRRRAEANSGNRVEVPVDANGTRPQPAARKDAEKVPGVEAAFVPESQIVPQPVISPVISHVTVAEKTATFNGMGGDNQECVLRIAKSKRNKQLEWTASVTGPFTATVTATDQLPSDNGKTIKGIVLTVQNATIATKSNIAMSDGGAVPAGVVRFREASAMDRADKMRTFADIVCDDGTTIPISLLIRDEVDRGNARSVVEAYVAAALAGRIEQAASLATAAPATRNPIESLSRHHNVQRLTMKLVSVNDPAKPTTALAISEAVKLTKTQGGGVLVLTLTMTKDGWSVTDIDFETEESAEVEVKRFLEAHPNAVGLPPLKGTLLPETDIDSRITPRATGKQLGTVLGKPIHEGDLNKNVSTEDNLKRLLLLPLTEHYCRQHKLDRDEELQTKIRDEKRRAMARLFVLPAELNRHLYEKHGGRVIMSPFGAVAFDGMKMWLEEREKAGDFEITDPELKATFHKHWIQEPAGAQFASPDQIKAAFDPALTDRFIDNLAKTIESAKKASRTFPFDQIKGHIASIKQRTTVTEAVTELRRITGLDFGNGVDRESRQAWLKWWEHETSCIDNAKDGVREFVLTGVITANGKPVSGANVQAHVPSKTTPNGKYQLAETLSDSSGRYVLVLGFPPFATAEDSTWKATFTVRNPPRFIADQEPVVMTLYRPKREDTDVALVQDTLEKNNDSLFAGVPFAMNFTLRPSVKPVDSADTDESPRIDQPVPPKSQDKLPDEKANDTQSDARSENGQTKFAIGNVSYSLPFNFPSVESILGSMPEAKSRPKIERIQCELVKYQMSDARFYPLVGQAQLVQTHFKSTITSDAGREVVYTDTSHLIRAQPESATNEQ